MSKWFGKIGFVLPTQEVEPGVWDSPVEEHEYYGDMTSKPKRSKHVWKE